LSQFSKITELSVDSFNRYRCPDHVNPAEFLADLISIDYSSAESVYSSRKRIDGLVESFSQQSSTILYATPLTRKEDSKKLSRKTGVKGKGKGSWWREFWLLLRRAWMQVGFSTVTPLINSHFISLSPRPGLVLTIPQPLKQVPLKGKGWIALTWTEIMTLLYFTFYVFNPRFFILIN
jgi:hypothetical protein